MPADPTPAGVCGGTGPARPAHPEGSGVVARAAAGRAGGRIRRDRAAPVVALSHTRARPV